MDTLAHAAPEGDKLHLHEGDIAPACVDALTEIVNFARGQLAAPNIPSESRVHGFRKAMRRARSLLRILRPSLPVRVWRDLERPIADAYRRFGAARDATMRVETWILFAARHRLAVTEVAEALAALEQTAVDRGPRSVPDFDGLYAALADKLPPAMNSDDLRAGLQATYKSARAKLRKVATVRDPVHVHSLRRRIKDLAYELELLTSLSPRPAAKWRARFGRLASELGEITDLYLLRDSLDRACLNNPALLSPPAKRDIDRAIDREVRDGLDDTLVRVREWLSRKPAKFTARFGL